MSVSEFSPTAYSHDQVIRPNNIPSRVFYRTRRKSGFLKTLIRKTHMNKSLKLRLAAISAGSLAMVGTASAAVDPAVTTAISNAGTDSTTVGAAVFVVIVAIFSIKLMRKAL